MKRFQLQIYNPEEIFFDSDIISLTAPGTDGYLGILANHTPIITSLKEGKLTITDLNNVKTYYKVSKGFLEVSHNKASIIVEAIQKLNK